MCKKALRCLPNYFFSSKIGKAWIQEKRGAQRIALCVELRVRPVSLETASEIEKSKSKVAGKSKNSIRSFKIRWHDIICINECFGVSMEYYKF